MTFGDMHSKVWDLGIASTFKTQEMRIFRLCVFVKAILKLTMFHFLCRVLLLIEIIAFPSIFPSVSEFGDRNLESRCDFVLLMLTLSPYLPFTARRR